MNDEDVLKQCLKNISGLHFTKRRVPKQAHVVQLLPREFGLPII